MATQSSSLGVNQSLDSVQAFLQAHVKDKGGVPTISGLPGAVYRRKTYSTAIDKKCIETYLETCSTWLEAAHPDKLETLGPRVLQLASSIQDWNIHTNRLSPAEEDLLQSIQKKIHSILPQEQPSKQEATVREIVARESSLKESVCREIAKDYQDPESFQLIVHQLFQGRQARQFFALKSIDESRRLPHETLRLASLYANSSDYRAARRELAKLSKVQLNTEDQKTKVLIEQMLSMEIIPTKAELFETVHALMAEVRDRIHEGRVDRSIILRPLGKAFDAANMLKERYDVRNEFIFRMLTQDLSSLSQAELCSVIECLQDVQAGLITGHPMLELLSKIESIATEARGLASRDQELGEEGSVRKQFLQMLAIRNPRGEEPMQHVFYDLTASVQHHTQEPKEAAQSHVRVLNPDEETPIGTLLKAYTSGCYFRMPFEVVEKLNDLGTSQWGKTKEYLQGLPIGLQGFWSPTLFHRGFPYLTSLLDANAMQRHCDSFSEVLERAKRGDAVRFVQACEKFLTDVRNTTLELEIVGKMFTDPAYLAKINPESGLLGWGKAALGLAPTAGIPEFMGTLQELGRHYLAIAAEMKNPNGAYRIMQEALAYAKANPGAYMQAIQECAK